MTSRTSQYRIFLGLGQSWILSVFWPLWYLNFMVIEPLVYTEFSDSIVLCSTKRHTCVTLYNKILHVQKISRFFVSAMLTQHASGKKRKYWQFYPRPQWYGGACNCYTTESRRSRTPFPIIFVDGRKEYKMGIAWF